jgi:hypothetical protein
MRRARLVAIPSARPHGDAYLHLALETVEYLTSRSIVKRSRDALDLPVCAPPEQRTTFAALLPECNKARAPADGMATPARTR